MGERKQGRPPSYPSVVTTTNINGISGSTSGSTPLGSTMGASNSGPDGSVVMGGGVGVTVGVVAPSGTNVSTTSTTSYPPSMSLESALNLYERCNDPEMSLKAYRRHRVGYESEAGSGSGSGDGAPHDKTSEVGDSNNDKHDDSLEEGIPVSRRHNEKMLSHLSMLRSSRRRPRPSSFDDDVGAATGSGIASPSANSKGSNGGGGGGGGKKEDNLAELLSTMLKISSVGLSGSQLVSTGNSSSSGTAKQREKTKKKKKKKKRKGDPELPSSNADTTSPLSRFNRLVALYNLCLANYAIGKYYEGGLSNDILATFLMEMDSVAHHFEEEEVGEDEAAGRDRELGGSEELFELRNLGMVTRMGFLILDCLLALYGGNGLGLSPVSVCLSDIDSNDNNNIDDSEDGSEGSEEDSEEATVQMSSISADSILSWIEKYALSVAKSDKDGGVTSEYHLGYDELKFKLHIYRSRVLFLGNADSNTNSGNMGSSQSGNGSSEGDVANRARLSRKELKSAMDIYQNKLCAEEEIMEPHGGSVEIIGVKGGGSAKHSRQGGKAGGGSSAGKGGGKATHRNSSVGKNNNQDGSETTSVTSMAGGSFVTSLSDTIWNDGKGGGTPRATFEGMPNKSSNASQQSQLQQAPAHPSTQQSNSSVVKKRNSPDLSVRHELALYLKANLEYLRGNATKSLKLCVEARSAGKKSRMDESPVEKRHSDITGEPRENGVLHGKDKSPPDLDLETQMASDYDEAIYYNNLALIHQAEGKVHVAMHYYSRALAHLERVREFDTTSLHSNFWSDGVARPDISAEILNNSSICAFQASDFKTAYECMARCVTLSPDVFRKRARCWLRMGQCCVGIYSGTNKNGVPSEMRICDSTTTTDGSSEECGKIEPAATVGSEDDLGITFVDPLPRARYCLHQAIDLSNANAVNSSSLDSDKSDDIDCIETALLSLAYVKLELADPAGSLEMCRPLLGTSNTQQTSDDEESRRRRAMAKVYACEALCLLEDPKAAMRILFGDDRGDGTTIESFVEEIARDPNSESVDEQYLAYATASGILACAGNFDKAKRFASSTATIADPNNSAASSGCKNDSFERRVQLYCFLQQHADKARDC